MAAYWLTLGPALTAAATPTATQGPAPVQLPASAWTAPATVEPLAEEVAVRASDGVILSGTLTVPVAECIRIFRTIGRLAPGERDREAGIRLARERPVLGSSSLAQMNGM